MIKRKEMCSDLIINIFLLMELLCSLILCFNCQDVFSHITQMNDKKFEKQKVLNVLLHCALLQQW